MSKIIVHSPGKFQPCKFGYDRIFLAGPIQGASDWQSQIIKDLEDIDGNEIYIYNPRRERLDDKTFNYDEQVEWEVQSLKYCNIIVFWLCNETEPIPGRSYAQTSRFELGEQLAKYENDENKIIIVGIEDGFHGARYIAKRINDNYPSVRLCNTYDELIRQIKKYI